TGKKPTNAAIQEYKNRGGFNDDWRLTHQIVMDAGHDTTFETVREHFQMLFRGNGSDGLILREQWVAKPGLLEELSSTFRLAVFTGRPKEEAAFTLSRFAPGIVFDPIIGMEDVVEHKPSPEGLLKIAELAPDRKNIYYVGDTIDDARCAKAARVPFIGITA